MPSFLKQNAAAEDVIAFHAESRRVAMDVKSVLETLTELPTALDTRYGVDDWRNY